MWPFKSKNPQDTSKIDDASFKEVKQEVVEDANKMIDEENHADMEARMVKYLQSKGYDVSPSGSVKGVVGKIQKVGEDTFHIGRGVARKVKGNIESKLNEFKEIGA